MTFGVTYALVLKCLLDQFDSSTAERLLEKQQGRLSPQAILVRLVLATK